MYNLYLHDIRHICPGMSQEGFKVGCEIPLDDGEAGCEPELIASDYTMYIYLYNLILPYLI